jgi:histone arginine demethylase JMJD6
MTKELEVVDAVPAEFYAEYVAKRRPLAIRGAANHWPAVGTWDLEFLKDKIGHHQVSQASLDQQEFAEFTMGDFLELLMLPPEEVDELPYFRNKFLHAVFPELSQDVGRLDWLQPNWLEKEPLASLIRVMRPNWFNWSELFVSKAGTRYPIVHTDHCMLHAWSAQIHGSKRYWVWAPIPGFRDRSCIGEDLETFLGHEPFTVTLAAGDVIFIPSNFPHTAESVTSSVTISGAYVNETNWLEFAHEFFATDVLKELQSR